MQYYLISRSLLFVATILIFILPACNNGSKDDAKNLAKKMSKSIGENTPGFTPTSGDGYYMKAKIDGKEWMATAMMPADNKDSRRVQGENNGESIGFSIWMRGLKEGKKDVFSEGNAVDLFTNDDVGIWGGREGEVVITKINDQVMEGTFHFTASTSRSDKTVEVTDGFFRMPLTSQ